MNMDNFSSNVRDLECVYRGEITGTVPDELHCCDGAEANLYRCLIHGRCSLGPVKVGAHDHVICLLCPDQEPN